MTYWKTLDTNPLQSFCILTHRNQSWCQHASLMIANGLGTEEKQGLYARSAYSRLQSCFWLGDEISMFTKTGSNSRWLFRFIPGQCQLQMKGCLWHLVMTYFVGAAIAYSACNCSANLAWVAYGDSPSINTAYGRANAQWRPGAPLWTASLELCMVEKGLGDVL